MSRIEEAIGRLERIADRPICFSRKEELMEVIAILKEEAELQRTAPPRI
ncbi:MAG: hypothetical protein A4E45_00380 [Methanosaeta sp. PtaB.Bin039]|nr:MAG: hypothetical protein A4E45_00380 [Methanosaeta sp. PtaB.Bin039]OPY44892.1 MAG: hypothetical protein A4E47_01259 [Methanosaeta sp. PtaU1.Bin028]HOT06276.1 hypothetical protein [Methanotrichaceae archaeon]HQF15717.1 hypothetical protein [Methanotrichaceae archaeon]HQI90610.1 hypothetical protein [Methanotrichaceae archaeon]